MKVFEHLKTESILKRIQKFLSDYSIVILIITFFIGFIVGAILL